MSTRNSLQPFLEEGIQSSCQARTSQFSRLRVDNHALDAAIEAGNLLGLPVVVYLQVIPTETSFEV